MDGFPYFFRSRWIKRGGYFIIHLALTRNCYEIGFDTLMGKLTARIYIESPWRWECTKEWRDREQSQLLTHLEYLIYGLDYIFQANSNIRLKYIRQLEFDLAKKYVLLNFGVRVYHERHKTIPHRYHTNRQIGYTNRVENLHDISAAFIKFNQNIGVTQNHIRLGQAFCRRVSSDISRSTQIPAIAKKSLFFVRAEAGMRRFAIVIFST